MNRLQKGSADCMVAATGVRVCNPMLAGEMVVVMYPDRRGPAQSAGQRFEELRACSLVRWDFVAL